MSTFRTKSNVPCLHSELPITLGRLTDFPDDPISCMRQLQATHGDLAVLEEQGQRLVFVFGPEWNQRVLADEKTFRSWFFAVRGPRNSAQRRLTSGLLSMNGEEHKRHRRMVMQPFQKKTIAGYHEAICRLTTEMLQTWQIGEVRDMHAEMTQFMLRLSSALLFGLDQPQLVYRVGKKIDRWVHLNHQTGLGAVVSDSRSTAGYDRLLDLAENLEDDIQQMIDNRRRSRNRRTDVLSLLIRAHDQQGGEVCDEKLIGHAALLFGAAHLTTAHTLTWTLFLLAEHPSIMRGVADEMALALTNPTPMPQEVTQRPYLERVIKESMRLLPASGYLQRLTSEPVELGPLKLSRGTPVIFSQFMTHHLPALYPDPERFLPDRWLEISPSAYAYLPFGAGSRMCIGGPLAMMIVKTALPMILERYRLTVLPGAEISGKIISSMLGPITSVPMLLSPLDGRFEASPVTGNIHSLVHLHEAPLTDQSEIRRAA